MNDRSDHIALAILRQGDGVVLVQQQTADHPLPYWVLPGGLVEAGELVSEALVREVQEEAGVQVTELGHLACLSQIERPQYKRQAFVYVFEIARWHGTLESRDPDQLVVGVQLISCAEVCDILQASPAWPGIRTPILAYLRGDVPAGAAWFYREAEGTQQLVQCCRGLGSAQSGPQAFSGGISRSE